MEHLASFDGTDLAYVAQGSGPPVLLLHGFAADHRGNWGSAGVIDALAASGRTVIATDSRGHGRSGKPHDPAAYADGTLVRDAQAVLDQLDVDSVDVVGYSMGAMVSARLVAADPRARSLVLGGVGGELVPPPRPTSGMGLAEAMLVEDPSEIRSARGRAFRAFADSTGADRGALAAIDHSTSLRNAVDFGAITVPTLVLIGHDDTMVGSADDLVGRLADARKVVVPGDHLSAVVVPAFTNAIVDFLAEVSPVG